MLKQSIGFFLMTVGVMSGDSVEIILPFIIILLGAWLILADKGDNE